MEGYNYTLIGTLVAIAIYIWSILKVGAARGKSGVAAPATTGHPEFERTFRAQQNTLEQIVIFLPLVWVTAHLWGDTWGGVFAAFWCVGRVIYILSYIAAAEKRSIGFLISGLASFAALVAGFIGVVSAMI